MSDRRVTSSIYRWGREGDRREAKPSRKALADLELRLMTPDTRTTTGKLLGDPPPGRSALDQKRERERLEAMARAMRELGDGD